MLKRAVALSLGALTLSLAAAAPTLAFERVGGPPFPRPPVLPAPRFHGGGGHFHGGHGVVVVGPTFWWGPWWYYPPPPAPQVIVQPAPVIVEQPQAESYWYYCPGARAYYPTVPSC